MMRGYILPILPLLLLLLPLPPAQASYEYASACIPRNNDARRVLCQLNIIGEEDTDIEIKTFDETDTFTLPAGTIYQKEYGTPFIPTLNVESKAIRIRSDNEVQVLIHSERDGYTYHQDVYMVPNQIRKGDTYYTSAYYRSDAGQCASDFYKQFYLVSSIYNDTAISVTQQNGTTYDLELPEFGTFVQTTSDEDNHLAIGTKIVSNKPVTVVSGNLCLYNEGTGSANGELNYSNIPEVASLGEEYIVPHIISDDRNNPAGYSVGVVATEDNTTVSRDGETIALNEGETAFFEYPLIRKSIKVICSKPCLVTQYTKGITREYGLFMQHILPEQQFSTSAFFTTLDSKPISYLSLVIKGEAPGDELYLNGNSLGFLNWTAIDGYSSAELAIPRGPNELVSTDGRPFAAYVYLQTLYAHAASGYALLPSESSRVTPEPTTTPPTTTPPTTTPPTTTPSPSVNGTLPRHAISVNGTAFSADGEVISTACVLAHSHNMDDKASDMVLRVNQEIGKTICTSAPDILVVSSLAALLKQHNRVLMEVYHVLQVLGHHKQDEVELCGLDVAHYLSDLSNWQQPIFPDVPDCSRMEIIPPYFNSSGSFWNCDNQLDEETNFADNTLAYESKVSEVFSTQDGSTLDVDCTRSYIAEVSKKTSSMMVEISAALADSGCDDIVMSVTHTDSFVADGDLASFQAKFYYVQSRSASFAEFVACMQIAHDFNLQHSNWSPGSQPGAPFMPVPPGCPALEHDTDTLGDGGHKWTCV